ncbi:hypothetical protein HYDPIDRAFT_115285 [Hydnomerulius pinastri MD-312]|uniref:Uncharacterized protein n=1 Tax=Hydnomerulius pinastri MD-312 TaxID=994086 RepID=A0A0C9VUT2_9AGAM|nr:hypothetical protein HYDPIDRAFT_115285 [Hydnomerulius pinastri MD-312]
MVASEQLPNRCLATSTKKHPRMEALVCQQHLWIQTTPRSKHCLPVKHSSQHLEIVADSPHRAG